MTEWTESTTIETGWATDSQSESSTVLYNDANIAYNLDYITYNGFYITAETDWAGTAAIETAWKE